MWSVGSWSSGVNWLAIALLRSRLHRLLSRKVQVVRYRGRRTGKEVTTPTQYVQAGDAVAVVVGKPETSRGGGTLVTRSWA